MKKQEIVNSSWNPVAGEETISYTYDGAGRRKSMVDGTETTSYAYSPSTGMLTTMTYPDAKKISYEYDANGSRIFMKEPFGNNTYYHYDDSNRLDTVGSSLDFTNDYEAKYEYYQDNLLKNLTQRNKVTSSFTYDGKQISSLIVKNEDEATLILRYSYDGNGNQTAKTENGTTSNFTYDALNRVSTSSQYNQTYQYDNRGNRQTMTTIQPFDRPDSTTTYDKRNRLTSVVLPSGSVTYRYNGDGLLWERTENGQTTRYYGDGDQVVAEATVSGGTTTLKVRYIRGQGLIAREDDRGKAYYVHNGHGDVVNLMDHTGKTKLNSYNYDLFGNIAEQKETIAQTFKYSGEMQDASTGLQYLRARWYDPSIGRFIGEDTYEGKITNPLSLNLYTYVGKNPLIYTDPSGHMWQWVKDLATSIQAGEDAVMGKSKQFCNWFGCADIAQGLSMMGPEFIGFAPAQDAILISEGAVIKTEGKFLMTAAKKDGVLNIGAGSRPIAGAYNIDPVPGASGVYYGTSNCLATVKTNSQGLIIFQNPYKYDVLTDEVSRVLQQGGKVEITGGLSNKTFNTLYKMSETEFEKAGYTLVGRGPAPDLVQGLTTKGREIQSAIHIIVLQKK